MNPVMPAVVEILQTVERQQAEIERLTRQCDQLALALDGQWRRGYRAGHQAAGRGRFRIGPASTGRPRGHLKLAESPSLALATTPIGGGAA